MPQTSQVCPHHGMARPHVADGGTACNMEGSCECDKIYDIYLLQLGFHPVAVVGRLTEMGNRQIYIEGETIHNTIQKHRTRKTDNKNTKQKNIKRILKNTSRVIRKYQREANSNSTTQHNVPLGTYIQLRNCKSMALLIFHQNTHISPISSHGRPTRVGPPAWELGEVLKTPRRKTWHSYVTDTRASHLN